MFGTELPEADVVNVGILKMCFCGTGHVAGQCAHNVADLRHCVDGNVK